MNIEIILQLSALFLVLFSGPAIVILLSVRNGNL